MAEEKIHILGYSDYECFNMVKAYRSKDAAEYMASEINHHMPYIKEIAAIYHMAVSHYTYNKYDDSWSKLSDIEKDTLHKDVLNFEKRCLAEVVSKFGKRYVNEHILSMLDFNNIYRLSHMTFSVDELSLI